MEQIIIALITLIGAICAGFFKLIADQTKVHSKLVTSMDKVATSNDKIAKETAKGNLEAKERNGHLAELTIQSNEQMLEAIGKIGHKQTVEEQNVIHQTVKGE